MIEPGTKAPDFTLRDQDLSKVSLSDYEGERVLLVFYPGDFSPVCSDQLSVYQEVLGEISDRGASLVGISVDGVFSTRPSASSSASRCRCSPTSTRRARVSEHTAPTSPTRASTTARSSSSAPDGTVEWSYASPSDLEIPGANLIFDALDR